MTSPLTVFLIALHRPACHDYAYAEERHQLTCYVLKTAAAYEDGAYGIDEIVHGIDIGTHICPLRHGTRRREESAEQHYADYEEPHDEDGLLHGAAVIADDKS